MLEHGQRVPRIDTVIRLAGAMAIPLDELLEGIHWVVGDPTRKSAFSFTEGPLPRDIARRGSLSLP